MRQSENIENRKCLKDAINNNIAVLHTVDIIGDIDLISIACVCVLYFLGVHNLLANELRLYR